MRGAATYSRLGWAVVPLHDVSQGACSCGKPDCPGAGKHPRTKAWQDEATSDAETVAGWAAQWPAANVGVATGEASGFWALDVDPGNGGVETLKALVTEHGDLPVTPTQRSGSGGAHYLWQIPAFPVRNTAGKLGPGLDTRGDGGQIVVAPSVSAKGRYSWVHAPWDVPIAPAPAWLLERLQRLAPRAVAPSALEAPTQTFPPASPEVLKQAHEAVIALHGPAVEGQGGDAHTFVACALLVHDFALTEEEAWPILVEWNETCQPPWSETDLAAKMRGGSKYATRPYGCRRTLDASAAIASEIAAYNAGPRGESAMLAMITRVRPLFGVIEDAAQHAVSLAALMQATGLKVRALDVPPPASHEATPDGAEVIHGGGRAQALKDADRILGKNSAVFQRNGELVLVAKVRDAEVRADDLVEREPESLVQIRMDENHILNALAQTKWVRHDKRSGEWLATDFPPQYAGGVRAASDWRHVRPLTSIIGAPTLDREMNVITEPGYHAGTGLLFTTSQPFAPVPEAPTKDDAVAALRLLRRPFSEFAWVRREQDPAHATAAESVHISTILTAGVRHLIDTAPATAYDAPRRGSGKTMLGDSVGIIWNGLPPPHANYAKGDDEFRKMLTSCLIAGDREILIDNVDRPIRSPELCNALTTNRYSDRRLGVSERLVLDAHVNWMITGNNLVFVGDLTRRVIISTIDPQVERPENRTFRIPHLLKFITTHRGRLAPAALTILKAFKLADPPSQAKPLGSFEQWSRMVREALIWVDMPDPCATTDDANEVEPETQALAGVLEAWTGAYGNQSQTAPDVAAAEFRAPELHAALAVAMGGPREIDARAVGYFLRRWKGVVVGDRRLRAVGKGHAGFARWVVESRKDGSWS